MTACMLEKCKGRGVGSQLSKDNAPDPSPPIPNQVDKTITPLFCATANLDAQLPKWFIRVVARNYEVRLTPIADIKQSLSLVTYAPIHSLRTAGYFPEKPVLLPFVIPRMPSRAYFSYPDGDFGGNARLAQIMSFDLYLQISQCLE